MKKFKKSNDKTFKYRDKKTNWKPTDNRFVGFLDLLGFKDKVMRKSHSEIYDELSKISAIKQSLEQVGNRNDQVYFEDADVYIVSFSDSIVIFSKNDSYENFEFFLVALRYLFSNAIKDNIAIKGGIAHGQISINKKEQIYFGQPIIDAFQIEEDVNYLGVVCHNTIDAYLKANKNQVEKSKIIDGLLFEHFTPLKSGKIFHQNLDWFLMSIKTYNKPKAEIRNDILDKLKEYYQTVSGSPRRYIDNTISLFNELMDDDIVNIKPLKTKPKNQASASL